MPTVDTRSLYARLCALPEGLTGEILDGVLHTQPRPAPAHAHSELALAGELYGPFERGLGGPGGWVLMPEPELHFVRKAVVCVPDLAGWRRERMPELPATPYFELVPDWVCEVLSPSTEAKDRRLKMPLYAHHGVRHLWLVDPLARTLEAFENADGDWRALGHWEGGETARIPPFDALALPLDRLWTWPGSQIQEPGATPAADANRG